MKIQTLWDNEEKTIIRFKRDKGWTFDDYHQAISIAEKMAKDAGHKVHIIHDSSVAPEIPKNALINFKAGNQRIASFAEEAVIVGDSMFMNIMFDMFKATNINIADHFTIVTTLEEAREILAKSPIDKAQQSL